MNTIKLQKYNLGDTICKNVFSKLKDEICNNKKTNVYELVKLGNELLIQEYNHLNNSTFNLITKKVQIAFPTCISLNNCNGYYIYEENNDDFNLIKPTDIVKIELGINIDNCITLFGDSFIQVENSQIEKLLKMLDKLEYKIKKIANTDSTNDDIRMLIESYCTKYNCFPVENTFSYQHLNEHIECDESKYLVTNYKKYYDEDDNLIGNQDICFELDENDVFTINLTIIPNDIEENEHVYVEKHSPHVFKYNEYFHNFKLQSSKEFYHFIKKTHSFNAFPMVEYKKNVKYRIGLKESLDNGILTYYPIYYSKSKLPILFKKFNIIIKKNDSTN